MIKEVLISNYKSILKTEFELGRINVFIGENGSGKSNILEAISFAAAASINKLDSEFLSSRGIRITDSHLFKSAFSKDSSIIISFNYRGKDGNALLFDLHHDMQPYSKWQNLFRPFEENNFKKFFSEFLSAKKVVNSNGQSLSEDELERLINQLKTEGYLDKIIDQDILHRSEAENLSNFLVYAPENNFLRNFYSESQIEPLGIKGEGLFKLLNVISKEDPEQIREIKNSLQLIDWFDDFEITENSSSPAETTINIKDKYFEDSDIKFFDQRSANEGFLYLLFYITLFVSKYTPKFFAIDNIDNALNPKLSTELIKVLVRLAKKYDKQAIFTTHNPAVLDGLNLNDDEQRLFVISRNKIGHTQVNRIEKKETPEGQKPVKLSEQFLRGYLGALPKNF